MKRIVVCAALCAVALGFAACSSTKGDELDSYGDVEATPIPIKKQSSGKADSSDPYSAEKIRGDDKNILQQLLSFTKYEKHGDITVNLKTTIGKRLTRDGSLIYKPHTDLGGFVVRYDTSSYAVYFAKAERAFLRAAVEQYLSDFENKALSNKKKNTEKLYGQVGAYEEFGLVELQMNCYSKPKVYFGYKFIKNSPFFCIYAARSPNLADNASSHVEQSVDQKYYFTKSQAQLLAEFLSDESIDALYTPPYRRNADGTPGDDEVDEYTAE